MAGATHQEIQYRLGCLKNRLSKQREAAKALQAAVEEIERLESSQHTHDEEAVLHSTEAGVTGEATFATHNDCTEELAFLTACEAAEDALSLELTATQQALSEASALRAAAYTAWFNCDNHE